MKKQMEYLWYRGDYVWRLAYRKLHHGNRIKRKSILGKEIMDRNTTDQVIAQAILSGKPYMVGRIGSVELSAMERTEEMRIGLIKSIPDRTIDMLCRNAGFFPPDTNLVEKYSDIMIESFNKADLLGSFHDNELYIFHKYASPEARICHLNDIEPQLSKSNTWFSVLEKKKVLVIHPCEETILSQYARKDKIFPNNFLPDFDLKTIKAVQTIAGTKDERFLNWFEALQWMEEKMQTIDYDVALIGCGAYGFPLAAYAKQMGKIGIHLGGVLQILFGIMGNRWETRKYVTDVVNEYWVKPSQDEIPKNAKVIEDACYW